MTIETTVQIKVKGHKLELTVAELKELRREIDGVLGEPSFTPAYIDRYPSPTIQPLWLVDPNHQPFYGPLPITCGTDTRFASTIN